MLSCEGTLLRPSHSLPPLLSLDDFEKKKKVVLAGFKDFHSYLMENCYVRFEETKAAICLVLGLFCFTHFGFTTLSGLVLILTSVTFACAAVNRRADEAAGLRRDSTPFEYPEDMKWGGGGVDQPQTTQSLLSAASRFGTF
eukprot:gene35671-43265_t